VVLEKKLAIFLDNDDGFKVMLKAYMTLCVKGAPMCQNMCFLIFVCEMFIFQPFLWSFFFVIFLIKFSFCNVSTNFVYGYCHIQVVLEKKLAIFLDNDDGFKVMLKAYMTLCVM
jgi:hypothetical protein